MTEQLEVEPQHRVLEIGTGSGYQAAILARIAREVVSIERYRTLADAARERIRTLGYANVTIRRWRRHGRRAGSGAVRPHHGHRRGRGGARGADRRSLPKAARWCCRSARAVSTQYIVKLTKRAGGELTRENLIAVRFVPLLPGQAREL